MSSGGRAEHVHVAIIGSGFAGLGAAIMLGRRGVDYTVLERASDLGGTWRDNTYPGCRCDVPSHLYSFSFAPNPHWSETYSRQAEIWDYLRDTADRYGVSGRIRFGCEVLDAAWDDDHQHWQISTSAGPLTADVLIAGNGPLAEPSIPDLPGFDRFGDHGGMAFHSAQWPADDDPAGDMTGRRVAVVGTGASAIQLVPEIRKRAAHVTVFQRTPGWVVPHRNRRITAVERAIYRRVPLGQRLVREGVYWGRELIGAAMVRNGRFLDRIEKLATRLLTKQVSDPELRAKVTPSFRPGCKRLMPSNDWYPALQTPNVDLVTEKVVGLTADGVMAADGVEYPVDTVVFATGFHVTDNPVATRISGADGRTLAERWEDGGACAYLGTTVNGFPNLFLLAGPNTGIGHTSLVYMIEAQLQYVVDAIAQLDRRGAASAELRAHVQERWADEIKSKVAPTVWNAGGCSSWYLDAEGRNTAIWPDLTFRFRRRTRRFDVENYHLTPRRSPAPSRERTPTSVKGA